MILVSQDGLKAFNMAYIRSYFIYQSDKNGYANFPDKIKNDDKKEDYIIWANPSRYYEEDSMYSIGKFKNLKDAQKVFMKLTSITNPSAEGCIIITEKDVDFFGKELPMWRDLNVDDKE